MALQLEAGDARGALETFKRCREVLALHFDARLLRTPPHSASGRRVWWPRACVRVPAVLAGPRADAPAGNAADGHVFEAAALARRAEAGGWLREGAALLRFAATEARAPAERGAILVNLAWLEHQLGHDEAATAAAEEGVAVLQGVEDGAALIDGLFVLGSLASHRGDDATARAWWSEALQRLDGCRRGERRRRRPRRSAPQPGIGRGCPARPRRGVRPLPRRDPSGTPG
jgi:hypothetical protein